MTDRPAPPIEVDCRTVHARRAAGDNFLLIDCREADEFAICSIAGAELIPMSEIVARYAAEIEPRRDDDVVVYCHHGGRSLRVAHWLRQQGVSRAQSMAGGIDLWAQEIEPGMARY